VEVERVRYLSGVEEATCAVTAEIAYNERVSGVENQIIARLRDSLCTARNAWDFLKG
jgi:hypothetical protein